MIANEFIRLPYLFSRNGIPPGIPKWGGEHKSFVRRYYKRNMLVKGPVQEMPVFENRVMVDASVTDAWSIPVARISGN